MQKLVGTVGTDEYTVTFKKYETLNDKRLGTKKFEKGSCIVNINATRNSNSGTAMRKFRSELSANEKARTVVIGATLH